MQDRKARLILNSVYSLLSWLAPLALGLIVTPIILGRLGSEVYGVYLVLIGFISYSFAFNAGRTLAKYVSEFHATGEGSRINDAISSAFWLNLGIGLFGACTIALIARWVVIDVLQIAPDYQRAAESALILGGFSIPAALIGQVFQNVLQGLHRFGKVSLLANLNWVLLNAGNVALVLSGFGIVGLFTWNLTAAVVIALISFVLVRRHDLNYVPGFGITKNMFAAVAGYGSAIFFYQLFGVILVLFERGWLIRKFGAAESAFYLLPMTLALYMHGLIGSLSLAVFPVVNELLADRERLVLLYQKASKVIFVTTAFSAATAISSGRNFLGLWVGMEFAENAYRNLVIHFLTFGLIAVMIIIWQVNEAHRAARINAIQVFVWGAVAIPLMVVMSGIWSAEGVAASRLFGVVVTIPMLFYCEKRFLGSVFWRFWSLLILKTGLAAALLVITEIAILSMADQSWFWLVAAGLVGTAVFASVVFLSGLVTPDERAIVAGLFRRRLWPAA